MADDENTTEETKEFVDYWSTLKLNECWSEKQRFNIIMNYIMKDDNNDEG